MAKLYDAEAPEKKTDAKDVGLWQERISIAKKDQETWSDQSGAKRFIKEYEGDYGIVFHTRLRKIPIPPINEVFTYVQSDIATTYNRDPYITCNPKAGTPKGAALWEVILNYHWRILKTKEELEYEIIDKDLVGFGWHKVGYAVNSIGKDETLKIESEKLYSSFLSWKDVLWNIASKRPSVDSRWMAQRIVRPLQEIKKKYPAAKGLEGSKDPTVDDDTYKKSNYKDDIKVGVLWEIWDAENKEILIIAENFKDKFLERKPWPEYLDEFPFLMYWDFAIPGKPRPMSAIAPWEPQILEEMIILGSAINHAKRWNRQVFVNTASIPAEVQDKFERGDDAAILTVNGKVGPDDLRFADFGQLPTDFYLIMDRLQAIKRRINGQPEFVQGGTTKTQSRTIGELQLMKEGVQGRQVRKVDRLETHCENIARHMMAHLKANFDFEQTVKISGDTPEEIIQALGENFDQVTGVVKFSAEEIQGEYDVDVKAGSTLPMDKQTRIQMMETILTTIAQAAAQGPMSHFMVTLIQELLKDYDMKSLEEAYKQDLLDAEKAKQEAQGQQSIDDQKTQAEAEKRMAQSQQIQTETELEGQELAMGPIGRAQLERLKKDPLTPKPVSNGAKR